MKFSVRIEWFWFIVLAKLLCDGIWLGAATGLLGDRDGLYFFSRFCLSGSMPELKRILLKYRIILLSSRIIKISS